MPSTAIDLSAIGDSVQELESYGRTTRMWMYIAMLSMVLNSVFIGLLFFFVNSAAESANHAGTSANQATAAATTAAKNGVTLYQNCVQSKVSRAVILKGFTGLGQPVIRILETDLSMLQQDRSKVPAASLKAYNIEYALVVSTLATLNANQKSLDTDLAPPNCTSLLPTPVPSTTVPRRS